MNDEINSYDKMENTEQYILNIALTSVIIRRLEANDYNKQYIDLLEELTIVNANRDHTITIDEFKDFVNTVNNSNGIHNIFVVEHKNKIIGTITLLIENKIIHGMAKVGHIEDIVVSAEYKGKKIGTKLVNFVVNEAKKINCYKVTLYCSSNVEAFYEKCGFVNKGSQMALYLYK